MTTPLQPDTELDDTLLDIKSKMIELLAKGLPDDGAFFKLDAQHAPTPCGKTEWINLLANGDFNVMHDQLGDRLLVDTTFLGRQDKEGNWFITNGISLSGTSKSIPSRTWADAIEAHQLLARTSRATVALAQEIIDFTKKRAAAYGAQPAP